MSITEILLPRTDGGALFQALLMIPVFVAAAVATRRNRDLLLFVAGLAMVTYAWFALRTVH